MNIDNMIDPILLTAGFMYIDHITELQSFN